MIQIYQKTVKDTKLNKLDSFRAGSWVHVENPEDSEIKRLSKKFSLKKSLLQDAKDPHEVPRMESDRGNLYIYTRIPTGEGNKIETAPLLIIIGENFVMTFSDSKVPFIQQFLKRKLDFSTTQKTNLLLQILFEISHTYSDAVTKISRDVRRAGLRLERIENKDIVKLVASESVLNDFLSALSPMNAILNNLLTGRQIRLYEEDKDLVEDLALASGQLIESCKANLKTIVGVREAYSTIMTNNLNRIIKLLTALTIILTVPTMISSFYGMNVPLPGANSPQAFLWILGGTVGVSAIILAVFNKKDWL